MKALKVLAMISLITLLFLNGTVLVQAAETLETTSWDITVFTYSIVTGEIQVSTAVMTFVEGSLTISDWTDQLLPGPYQEILKQKGIKFSATVQKPGIIQQYVQNFSVKGMAVMGKGIAGIIENTTTGWYYFFFGELSSPA